MLSRFCLWVSLSLWMCRFPSRRSNKSHKMHVSHFPFVRAVLGHIFAFDQRLRSGDTRDEENVFGVPACSKTCMPRPQLSTPLVLRVSLVFYVYGACGAAFAEVLLLPSGSKCASVGNPRVI